MRRCILVVLAACAGAPPAVAPVRPTGTARYAVAGPLVLDRRTGLTWQRNAPDAAPSWAAAKAACEGLTVDGKTFRLPTLEELKTLVDERLPSPTLDREAFPGARAGWVFTATPLEGSQRFVWVVDFDHGGAYQASRKRSGLYRCLQIAPPQPPAPYDEPPPPDRLPLNAQVVEAQRSADRVALKVAFKAGPVAPFAPGQSVLVGAPVEAPRSRFARGESVRPPAGAMLRRRYTVVSTPRDLASLELVVKLVPDGQLSPRLHGMSPGDALWLSPVYEGRPTLEVAGAKNLVLFATGSGVASFLGALRTLGTSDACEGKRKVALLHGAARADGLWYREELTTLARACKSFVYVPSLLRPELETPMWPGAKGALDEVWARRPLRAQWGADPTPRDTHVRVCADVPDVTDALARALEQDGFSEADISFCEVE